MPHHTLSLPLMCLKETLRPLSWAVSHFFDGLVWHPGSREATTVQIHKRLGELPTKACSRHRSAPTSNIEPHLAPERAQQQPLMTHIFTHGVQLTAPSHHHGQRERLLFSRHSSGKSTVLHFIVRMSSSRNRRLLCPSPAKEMIASRCSCRSPVGPGALMDASLTCGSDTIPVLLWPCSHGSCRCFVPATSPCSPRCLSTFQCWWDECRSQSSAG